MGVGGGGGGMTESCHAAEAATARSSVATAAGSPSFAAAVCTRLSRSFRCTDSDKSVRRGGHAGLGTPASCSSRSTLLQTASACSMPRARAPLYVRPTHMQPLGTTLSYCIHGSRRRPCIIGSINCIRNIFTTFALV